MARIEKNAGLKRELDPKIKALRDKHRTLVRGKFIYHEVPNGNMSFPFREFPGDSLETYNMNDGEIYTVPLGVAKHLNTNCWYPAYDYKDDSNGRPVVKMVQKIRRCSFQSLEFLEIEGVKPIGSPLSGIEEIRD